jgi:hypothetical protein
MRRTKTKYIQDLLEYMWGFGEMDRKGWEDRAFRTLSFRACQIMEYCISRVE